MTKSINDIAGENLMNTKLKGILADLSYTSTGGIKEYYRGGTNVNVNLLGQQQFQANKPIDKITYDMIDAYQKESSKPAYKDAAGNEFKYMKGEFDYNIAAPVFIDDLTLGRPVNEADIINEQAEITRLRGIVDAIDTHLTTLRKDKRDTNLLLSRARSPVQIAKYNRTIQQIDANIVIEEQNKANALRDIRTHKGLITNYRTNINDNIRIDKQTEQDNIKGVKKYEDALRQANINRLSVSQNPAETRRIFK